MKEIKFELWGNRATKCVYETKNGAKWGKFISFWTNGKKAKKDIT